MVIDMNAPLKYNKERYLKELREKELRDELIKKHVEILQQLENLKQQLDIDDLENLPGRCVP